MMTKREKKAGPDPVDVYVGGRIRMRRNFLGFSQEKLADQLGITFQQVQKYENGSNRVGSSRLYAISKVLGAPIAFFFDGYNAEGLIGQVAEDKAQVEDYLNSKETVDLLRAYYAIEDKAVRRKVFEMLKSLAPVDKK